jgi:hypothetical protein
MAASGFNPGMPDVVSLPEGKERDREFLVVVLRVEGSRVDEPSNCQVEGL